MADDHGSEQRPPILITRSSDNRFYDVNGARDLSFEDLQEMVMDGTPFEIRDIATQADVTADVVNDILDSLA
jgi:polyhydroxyalkanoate synthesis regulator protein